MLRKSIDELECFHEDNIINPENPKLKYNKKNYEISSIVKGNKLNKDIVYKKILEAVLNGKTSINLDKEKCYEKPKYNEKSSKVVSDIEK